MEEWGNKRANEYWEANLPNHVIKPKEGDTVRVVEKFIRDKYEFKRFIGKSLPPKHNEAGDENAEEETTDSPVARRPSKHSAHHSSHHHHSTHHHSHHKSHESSNTPSKPVEQAPPAKKQEASLIDFMDDQPSSTNPVSAPSNNNVDFFASPNGNGAAFASNANNFDPFATAPAPVTAQQQVPVNSGFPSSQQNQVLFPFDFSFCCYLFSSV
jgi:hypothetical protein